MELELQAVSELVRSGSAGSLPGLVALALNSVCEREKRGYVFADLLDQASAILGLGLVLPPLPDLNEPPGLVRPGGQVTH
jgi:hypothetical protein